jgi:hypothetical protein
VRLLLFFIGMTLGSMLLLAASGGPDLILGALEALRRARSWRRRREDARRLLGRAALRGEVPLDVLARAEAGPLAPDTAVEARLDELSDVADLLVSRGLLEPVVEMFNFRDQGVAHHTACAIPHLYRITTAGRLAAKRARARTANHERGHA